MRVRHQSSGFTLVESIISVTVISIILGVIITSFIVSMRLWRRCSSQSLAFPPAYLITTRLEQELKNAYYVSVSGGGSSITFRLPSTDANGINVVPLTLSREISYYLSDQTGQEGLILQPNMAKRLWRKQIDTSGTTRRQIAENIQDLRFQTAAQQTGRVFTVYSMSVTIVGKEGESKEARHTSTFNSTMAIRNPLQQ